MLYLLDASSIHLEGFGFDDWAKSYRSNVSQGLKLHLMIEGRYSSPDVCTRLPKPRSAIFEWDVICHWKVMLSMCLIRVIMIFTGGIASQEKGATFVTRLKKNANVTRLQTQVIPQTSECILEDATIRMNSRRTNSNKVKNPYYGQSLRRIIVSRPDKDTPLPW